MKFTNKNLDIEIRTEVSNVRFDEFGVISKDEHVEIVFNFYDVDIQISIPFTRLEPWLVANVEECGVAALSASELNPERFEEAYISPLDYLEYVNDDIEQALFVLNTFLLHEPCV